MVSIRPFGRLNHFPELRFALFDTLAHIFKFRKLTVSCIIPFRSAPFQALPQSNYGSLSFALFNFQGPVLRRFQQDFFNRISRSRLFLSVSLERSTIIPNRFLFVNTFSQKKFDFFQIPFYWDMFRQKSAPDRPLTPPPFFCRPLWELPLPSWENPPLFFSLLSSYK